MLPHDVPSETRALPAGDRRSAVYFSGDGLRQLRLGYLIQERFPGLLKAWWISAPKSSQRLRPKLEKAWRMVSSGPPSTGTMELLREGDLRNLVGIARRRIRRGDLRRLGRIVKLATRRDPYARVEEEMFGAEVKAFEARAALHPERVDRFDSEEHLARMSAIDPYLIVTFGGPLLRGRVLEKARGLAINQHAGWSPSLKGSYTTETAIYHRELGWIGNTVHVMDTQADSGAILRRSTCTLHPDDDLAHCVLAVCAVGSKLMLESIDTILHADRVDVFPQPRGGQTLLNVDFTLAKRDAVARDLRGGWLADALAATRDY